MSGDAFLPADPASLERSRPHRVLLVLRAFVGVIVSAARVVLSGGSRTRSRLRCHWL
jgi:hypothetical protein